MLFGVLAAVQLAAETLPETPLTLPSIMATWRALWHVVGICPVAAAGLMPTWMNVPEVRYR
jgi:hypothetical protein